jgi:hypothetical protein
MVMLKLTVIMNSSVEAIFAAKCCAIPDANLEIILTNAGETPITVSGRFSLIDMESTVPLNLYPHGLKTINPGEGAAFYGTVDPDRWPACQTLTVKDSGGHRYMFDLLSTID